MAIKERGFAVISGSSTVVARIMENGTVVFGQDKAITGSISGTLVLNLPNGPGIDGKVVQIGTNNSASIAQLSASQIVVIPVGNLTSSNVQLALEELQNEITYISGNVGATTLTVSASDGTGTVALGTGQLKLVSSDTNLVITKNDTGDDVTVTFDVADSPTFVNITATTLSASSYVSASTLNVVSNASVGGNLTITGDLTVNGTTVTLETQNLKVEDPIIVLGSSSAGQVADGDRGLIFAQSGTVNDPAFGWDASDSVFRLGTTTDDGSTPSLTINPNASLQLGSLSASNNIDIGGNLTVGGSVTLPAGSISNTELVNSSINISGGVGISVSGLESISLGGSGSISLNLSELSTVTVDVATDSIAIVDASNSSGSALTTVSGLVSGLAGTGLTATNGVLSVNYGSSSGTAVQGNTTLTVSGTLNEVEVGGGLFQTVTLGNPSTITIGLPDTVTIGNLTVTGSLIVSGNTTLGTGTEDTITVVGNLRHPVFSVSGANAVAGYPIVPNVYITNASSYGGYSFYLTSSATTAPNGVTPGSGSWDQANKWYFNENGEWFASFFLSIP